MSPLPEETASLLRVVHAAAEAKHAKAPVALDVHELSSFTDALYVCHADSTRGVQAIAEAIVKAIRDEPGRRASVEGLNSLQWVLIDAGTLMVHVFLKERRDYYTLERLWHDAPQVALEAA